MCSKGNVLSDPSSEIKGLTPFSEIFPSDPSSEIKRQHPSVEIFEENLLLHTHQTVLSQLRRKP